MSNNSNILAICSALNNSYLALEYENDIKSEIIKSDDKNYHSLYLISKIKNLTKETDLKKLDAIAVNLGQGSFTGIRVALSIAKVMAGELNIALIGLNTTEILLNAYNKKILIMDARRDMYYLGTSEGTKLVYKKDLNLNYNSKDILCDERCLSIYPNADCYENIESDLGLVMLKLAKEKLNNSKNKDEFNYLNVQANYIQTPPVM